MHGLYCFMLLGARGPASASPGTTAAPTNVKKPPAASRVPAVTLTPGVYALRRVLSSDGPSPALEPVPLPMTCAPPAAAGGAPLLEPRYISEKILYARLPLGDAGAGVLIALDESAGTGYGYDRLYADANLDRNLAATPPIEGRLRRAGSLQNVDFDCPALPALYHGANSAQVERRAVRVRLHGYRLGQAAWRFSWDLGEYRAGEIASSRGPVQLSLADSAMRAVFNHVCVYHSALPTADGAGPQISLLPDPTRPASREPLRLSLGAAQLLSGRLYTFEPNADGSVIAVRAYSGTSGRARIDAANARRQAVRVTEMALQGDTGRYEVGNDVVEQALPEGQYYTIATIRQPDRDGDWVLTFRSRGAFRLPAAKETRVPIGGALHPLIAPDAVQLLARRGQEITLPLTFVTAAGHQLTAFDSPDGFATALVVVRTTTGHVIARGRSGFA